MEQLTVRDLFSILYFKIKNDKSILDKKIVISNDNEGNGYHGMYFGLTKASEETVIYDSSEMDRSKMVVLG